jgi:hypothetical protein
MGRLQATEMVRVAKQDVALQWHLTSNHYPPLPVALVAPCQRAIRNANRGLWERRVMLPKGYGFRPWVTTAKLVEGCHLDAFLDQED